MSEKIEHTPSPWDESAIYTVLKAARKNDVWPERDPEFRLVEEDAQLIAAAPDLLSIAKRWVALDGGVWNTERHSREKAELLEATKNLIAQVEGRAALSALPPDSAQSGERKGE